MKKLAVLLLVIFLSFGCASFSPRSDSDLEARMEALEKQVKKIELMAASGAAAATDRFWPFYGLTGGGNALDGIAEANIGANDTAIGRDSSAYGYIYYWDATHAAACSSPACIRPADTDNTGSWLNVPRFYAEAFYSSADDGDHYVDPSNASAFPTGMAEGSIACRDDRDACFVYDGSSWWPLLTGKYVAYTNTGTIAVDDCWGGVITNAGAGGNITLTLPSAVQGMNCKIAIADSVDNITIQEGAGDALFQLSSITLDDDVESVTLYAISTSTWVVIGDSASPTYTP